MISSTVSHKIKRGTTTTILQNISSNINLRCSSTNIWLKSVKRKSKNSKKFQSEKSKVSASIRTCQEVWSKRRFEARRILNQNSQPPLSNVIIDDVFPSIGNEIYYETKEKDKKQTPWLGLIDKAGRIFSKYSEREAAKYDLSLSLKKVNNDVRLKDLDLDNCVPKTTMEVLRVLKTPLKSEHYQQCIKLCTKSRSFLKSPLAKRYKIHSEMVRKRFAQVIHNGTLLFNYAPIYSQKLHQKLKLKTSGDVVNWNDYVIPQLPCIVCYRRLFNVGGKTVASRSGIKLRKNRARVTCDNRPINFYKEVVFPLKKCSKQIKEKKTRQVNSKKLRDGRITEKNSQRILSNVINKLRKFKKKENEPDEAVCDILSKHEVVNLLLRKSNCKKLNRYTISGSVLPKPLVYSDFQQGRGDSKNEQVITKVDRKSLFSDFMCLKYLVIKIFDAIRTPFSQISFRKPIEATERYSNVKRQIKKAKDMGKFKVTDIGLLGIFLNTIKYFLNSSCAWIKTSSPFARIASCNTGYFEMNCQTRHVGCQKEFLKSINAKANNVSSLSEIFLTNGMSNKQSFYHKSYLGERLQSNKNLHKLGDSALSSRLLSEFPKKMNQERNKCRKNPIQISECFPEKSTSILKCENKISNNHVIMAKRPNYDNLLSPVDKYLKSIKKDMRILNPNSVKSSPKENDPSTRSLLDMPCQYKTGLTKKNSVCEQLNKLPLLSAKQNQKSFSKFDNSVHDRLRKIINDIQEKIAQRLINNSAVPIRNASRSSKRFEIKILRSCDIGDGESSKKFLSLVDASVDCHLDHNFSGKSVRQRSTLFQNHFDKLKKLPSIFFQMFC